MTANTTTSPRKAAATTAKTQKIGVWMPLAIGDFHRDIAGFPAAFAGIYINLLTRMWQNSGRLPADDAYLQRLSGATPKEWASHRHHLAALFVVHEDFWTHNDLRVALKKAEAVSSSRSAAGEAAVNARWDKTRKAKAAAQALMAKVAQDGGSF